MTIRSGRGLLPKRRSSMKKPVKRLATVLVTAAAALSSLSVSSSALNFCFGGNCFNVGLPSGGCNSLLQIANGQFNVQTVIDCLKGQNCGKTQITDCTGGNCGSAQTDCDGGNCVSGQPAVQTGNLSSDVSQVLTLVNSERAKNGLSALAYSSELSAAAEIRAKEIVRSFSHTRPNGSSCFTVLAENGITYRTAGENLAYGQRTASAVMNGWMNSSGHRANILGRGFGRIGIACYTQNGVKYWVQIFTN